MTCTVRTVHVNISAYDHTEYTVIYRSRSIIWYGAKLALPVQTCFRESYPSQNLPLLPSGMLLSCVDAWHNASVCVC